ncbi:hypothetical protein BpHYR1_053441 [Brachionus plicatilis]|uniref:Uncharacterized protein n=1 Tax=Brachionus plicatilis TaxID=10195 RepID=A0A3M7QIT7_BRAPC|nr:hypothetical protein BpHYR1_053441 [Brachionus plicatilis]
MSSEYSKKTSCSHILDTNDSSRFLSQDSLSSSATSFESNQTEHVNCQDSLIPCHRFDLDHKEYDKLKQTLIELELPTEFKILNLIPDDEANNILGDWQVRTQANSKVFHNKPLGSRPNFSFNNSSNFVYQFRNFNDWRSHLIYYKQKKNGLGNLPSILKEIKQNNVLPTVVKQIESEDLPIRRSTITRSQTLIHFKRENTFNKNTRIIENENSGEPFSIKNLRSKYLNHVGSKSKTTDSFELNFSAPASISSVPKQNIDFKMDFNKQKLNENPNQKFIPYLKGKRAGGGVVRVSSDVDKSKIQLQKIPPNILKKFMNQKANSFNAGVTSILNSQNYENADDTYYTITSINNAEKKLNSTRKVVSFYENENENDDNLKSTPSRADENPLSSRSKSGRSGTKNDSKVPIGQPSLAQFIKTANLVSNKTGGNMKNFKQIANKIKKQHKEMMKQRQSNENQSENGSDKGMVPELKGVSVSEKNLVSQPVRFELTN